MKDFRDWQGKAVLDREGHKVGNIGQLYVDDRNNEPAWATVRTNEGENFFPVSMAHVNGDDIVIDMPVDDVAHAPKIEADEQISTDEEWELYQYYRQKWNDNTDGADLSDDDMHNPTNPDDRSDDADSDNGKVHLRRYTVTELVTEEGDVQRKEVTIEKLPVDDNDMLEDTITHNGKQAHDPSRRNTIDTSNTDYDTGEMDKRI